MPNEIEFLRTISELFRSYITYAWPFAFLHAIVVLFVVLDLSAMSKEIRWLKGWEQDPTVARSCCAAVLQQFVAESERWGTRGVFVPMTDFSDRLDSYVSGKVDSLHSHINLFLIVGVAGTFFAMFKFAVSVTATGVAPETISRLLATGLATAFPVGFVGLLLSVVFHFVAYRWENRLSLEVNDATRNAMRLRQQAGKGVLEQIQESLAPLQNLQETLQGSLQPVIEGFRSQLGATSKLIEDQIQPLSKAVGAFSAAVDGLAKPSQALADAARELPSSLQESTRVQAENRAVLVESAQFVRETSVVFQEASGAFKDATVQWHSLPADLRAGFEEQLERMSTTASKLWNGSSEELFASLKPACAILEASAASLGVGASALSAIPQTICGQLVAGLERLASTAEQGVTSLQATYSTELKSLSSVSFDAWTGSCNQFVNSMNTSTIAFCGAVGTNTAKSTEALTQASYRITEICNAFDSHLPESVSQLYKMSLHELRPYLQRMDEAITERYPAALHNLTEACDRTANLKHAAEDATTALKGIDAALRTAAVEWRKGMEERQRNVYSGPTPEELSEMRAIRAGIDRMADRFGQPFWKTWFKRNGSLR